MPSYTFPSVTEDHSISVRFSGEEMYSVSKTVISGQGTVILSPDVGTYPEGSEISVTCIPAEGYEGSMVYLTPSVPWIVPQQKFRLTANVNVGVEFYPIEPPTPTGEDVKMYIKENGHWVPLFEE